MDHRPSAAPSDDDVYPADPELLNEQMQSATSSLRAQLSRALSPAEETAGA